jgi:hypothetical protein
LGKQFARPYLKKHPTQKRGWWSGSRCRAWVQTPAPPKKSKNQETNMANCSLGVVIRCIDVFQYYYTYFNLKRNNSTYEYNKKKIKRNNICNAGRTQYDIEKHPR